MSFQKNKFLILFDILLILILSLIPILNLPMQGIVSPIDTEFPAIPEIPFIQSLYRWSEFNNGFPNIVAPAHDIPVYGITLFLQKLGIELWILNRLWFIVPLFLLGFSGYYFAKSLVSDENSRYIGLITSFLLIFSLPTAYSLSFGWSTKYILPIAFSIFLISFIIRGVKDHNSKKYILYGGITSIFVVILPNILIVTLVIILIYLLLSYNSLKKKLKYYFELLLIVFLINMYFFLPFLLVKKSGFQYYHIDPLVTVNLISDFNTVLRTLTLRNSIPPIPLDTLTFTYDKYLISLIIIIIAFSSLLTKKYKQEVLFLSISTIFLLILAGGNSPPFGSIYMFAFQNIPMFEVFREVSKFNGFLMLNYATLFSISILTIIEKFRHIYFFRNKRQVIFLFGGFIILIIGFLNSYPLYTGDLNGGLKEYKIPKYYFEYNEYINQKNNPNILILPMPAWFSNFNWHSDSNNIVNIIRSINPSPIIYDEINQINLNPIQLKLYQSFLDETNKSNETLPLINILGIRNVLIQEDQINNIPGNIPPKLAINLINNRINKSEYLNKDKQFGDLKLYEVNKSLYVPPIVSYTALSKVLDFENFSYAIKSDGFKSWENIIIILNQNQNKNIPEVNSKIRPTISFQKINPTKYILKIEHSHEPFYIGLDESFNSNWKAYLNIDTLQCDPYDIYFKLNETECRYKPKIFEITDLTIILKKSIDEEKHFVINGYANGWYIDPKEIDSDNDGEFYITLYFMPQSYMCIGLIISSLTLILYFIYYYLNFFMRKR